MRELTKKQKQMLKQWFDKNYHGGYMFDLLKTMDLDLLEEVEAVNPTEVFYQNAEGFLEDLVDSWKGVRY